MEKFYGNKYRMERCENLDELLIEMGEWMNFSNFVQI